MSRFISIHITTPDLSTAQKIGQNLVENNLVACAQIEGPVKSIYKWESKLENDQEWRLILKSIQSNFELIEKIILDLHPYDVPQVISFNIDNGSKEYLDWIERNCAQTQI